MASDRLHDFPIPDKPTSLCTKQAGPWRVQAQVEPSPHELQEVARRLDSDPYVLGEAEVFSLIFSALNSFDRLSAASQQATSLMLVGAVQITLKACKRAIQCGAPDSEGRSCRTLLKVAVYLLSWLVQEAEKLQADAPQPKKGPGTAKSGKRGKADDIQNYVWETHREQAALRLQEVVDALEPDASPRLTPLWGASAPDEPFIIRISMAAYAMLGQPAALKTGGPSLRDALWRLVAIPAQRYGQAEATVSRIVPLILESASDFTITQTADLLLHLLHEHKETQLVASVLSELSNVSANDAKAADNSSSFMTAFIKRAPLMIFLNMDQLIQPHLNSESYVLRRGAVRAYSQLLVQLAMMQKESPVEASTVLEEIAPSEMVQVLYSRTADTSTYVRTPALEALCQLCETNTFTSLCDSSLLPLSMFLEAARVGLERLADSKATVRKQAVQLFCKLLDHNPFRRPSFKSEDLHAELEACQLRVEKANAEDVASSATASDRVVEQPKEEGETGAESTPASAAPSQDERALELARTAVAFQKLMQEQLLTKVMPLLDSQQTTDVEEATKAIMFSHCCDLDGAKPAAILPLVFSKEPKKVEAAVQAVQAVYLHFGDDRLSKPEQLSATLQSLIKLVKEANLNELASLEKLIAEWHQRGVLPSTWFASLWDAVRRRGGQTDPTAALMLINMAAASDLQVLSRNKALLIEQATTQAHALAQQMAQLDLKFARHVCSSLRLCAASEESSTSEAKSITAAMRCLLVHPPPAAQAAAWYGVAEQAISNIFAYAEAPEQLCTKVLHEMGSALRDDTVCPSTLSRTLFCVGHIAIKTLAHIERCEKALGQDTSSKAGATTESAEAEAGSSDANVDMEKEYLETLGMKLVDESAMLGAWAPLIATICRNDGGVYQAELRSNAMLALCKFMCVSVTFCQEHLELLFSVIERDEEVTIRANAAVALGDLACSHLNEFQPWSPRLYSQLSEAVQPDARVRYNILTVITHLILGGKILLNMSEGDGHRSGAAELARCLVDADARIVSRARLFFTDYAKKEVKNIYTVLPGIISTLANDATLPEAGFRLILTFLIQFVPSGQLTENVVKTQCERFDRSDEPIYMRRIAFCVCALNHTDKSLQKLHEHRSSWGAVVVDEGVYACFSGLVARMRKEKSPAQQGDIKVTLDRLEDFAKKRSQGIEVDEEDADENVPPQA